VEHKAGKALVGVEQLTSTCGESQALHCPVEAENKQKTVSLRPKLISNSRDCPVTGRGWWLLTYQPLMGPLLRICLLQMPHSTPPPHRPLLFHPSPPTTSNSSKHTNHWIVYYTKFIHYLRLPIPPQPWQEHSIPQQAELHLNA
jgi:hypothetical protein